MVVLNLSDIFKI